VNSVALLQQGAKIDGLCAVELSLASASVAASWKIAPKRPAQMWPMGGVAAR
jgi:hypothetical protein